MSTLAVTTIISSNTITDLTMVTGNTSGPAVIVYADGSGISFKNNATTNAVFIAGNGNFSVGASNNALFKLDIRGAASALINSTNPTSWISTDTALTSGVLFSQFSTSNNMGVFGTKTNHNLSLVTNNSEKIRVDVSGNTGIGISLPTSKLHVVGTANITANTTIGGSASISGNVALGSSLSVNGIATVISMLETVNVSATAATGTVNLDMLGSDVLYYTTSATANCTVNLRGNSSTTANSIIGVGQSMTVTFLMTNGTTAYVANAFSIDGSAQTVKWQGGLVPPTGSASAVDMYTFTAIKTSATPTYTVFASQTKYA